MYLDSQHNFLYIVVYGRLRYVHISQFCRDKVMANCCIFLIGCGNLVE